MLEQMVLFGETQSPVFSCSTSLLLAPDEQTLSLEVLDGLIMELPASK